MPRGRGYGLITGFDYPEGTTSLLDAEDISRYLNKVISGGYAKEGAERLRGLFFGGRGESGPERVQGILDQFMPGGAIGHTVYHGSPHKFSRFDVSKIGSGQGAQTYGHGLYFAENPEVAETYRRQLQEAPFIKNLRLGGVPLYRSGRPVDYGPRTSDPGEHAKAMLQEDLLIDEWNLIDAWQKGGEEGVKSRFADVLKERMDYAREEVPEYLPFLQSVERKSRQGIGAKVDIEQPPSYMYTADIPDEWLPRMLDWDKPLADAPKWQQEALQDIAGKYGLADPIESGRSLPSFLYDLGHEKITGSPASASRELQRAGIPGIMYLDQGSREATEGTRNFVTFGDEGIELLRRDYSLEDIL